MPLKVSKPGLGLLLAAWLSAGLPELSAHAAPSAAECSRIRQSIASLSAEVRELQAELKSAAPGGKPRLATEIGRLGKLSAAEKRAGAQCPPVNACGQTICTPDPRPGFARCKTCRSDNCDGTSSVSVSC